MIKEWLTIFREMGHEVSDQTLKLYGRPEGAEKLGIGAGGDITLKLDKIAEDIIITKLMSLGNVKLISEEIGETSFGEPEVVIIADPLDGSTNAKQGIPQFSISLAVLGLDGKMNNRNSNPDEIDIEYQVPHVFVKTIWQRIFNEAGLEYHGNFFATNTMFNNELVPADVDNVDHDLNHVYLKTKGDKINPGVFPYSVIAFEDPNELKDPLFDNSSGSTPIS